MDTLPGGAVLARGLLVLARSGQSGVLSVMSEGMTARIGVRGGRVLGMRVTPDDGDSLGSALRRMGAWDESRAGDAELAAPEHAFAAAPRAPLGEWGVSVGATTAAAVSLALRHQLRRRVVRLFALDPLELRLSAGATELGVAALSEPPTCAELIVSALRERVSGEPLLAARRRLGDGLLVLTSLGRELLENATLWPEEQAMVSLLSAGASVDVLIGAAGGSARAQRTLYGLRALGACGPPEPREGYAVLLRKRRQLQRGARATELLDLPAGARGNDARRALRRLASAVHPDRFGDGTPDAIRSASLEVMTALVRAQRDLG